MLKMTVFNTQSQTRKMIGTYVVLIYAFLLPLIGLGQSDCESKQTCGDCIQEVGCIWCISPANQTEDKAPIHCVKEDTAAYDWCPEDSIISPILSEVTLDYAPFSSDISNPVQFRPQRVKLSLRKGEKEDVHFQYQQAKNYPVDLYFIMDLSNSMNEHKKKLGELGVKLARALQKLTTDIRLGFGSFVDKVDLPFVSTSKEQLKAPCNGCAPAYSFKNHLSLSSDYEQFKTEVKNANVSGNLVSPERGLDAIMQAIVCKEEIGWRSQARHLLVFSTDAQFHIAGDGKPAGVIEPNDAKCHMVRNEYIDYLKYDYPSVCQINHVAKENDINIIFAIVAKDSGVKQSYQMLSNIIENSNFGELDNNNSNIIELVTKNYNKIVQSVTLTSNATDDVVVKFSSTCPNPKINGCSNVSVDQIVDFTATIQALKCLPGGPNKPIISIKPNAVQERFIIELDIICDCDCSSTTDPFYQINARECNGNGDLACGICKCAPGRFGRNCQCDNSDFSSDDSTNCKMSEQAEICSGQGECKCGKCECNSRPKAYEKIYGKFCQCDNYSCKRKGGLLCSGNGTCDCGECKCYAGYTGDGCHCHDTNTTCISPESDLVCSGYGECKCGQCECTLDGGHSGKYCEECITCPVQRMYMDEDTDTGKFDEKYEKIDVPDFGDGRNGRFLYDFNTDFTGIIDITGQRCFVMPLNRQNFLPPKSVFDFIHKMWNDYYKVDTAVIKRTMRVVLPPITDTKSVGRYISTECEGLPIYKLEKIDSGVVKSSADLQTAKFVQFAGNGITEFDIINLDEVLAHEKQRNST